MILFKLEPKYIRTKDGRLIDLTAYIKGEEINGGIKFIHKINGNFFFVQIDNILKKSNDIKELCDEFVVFYENHASGIVYHDLEWAKTKAQKSSNKSIICGAIWVIDKNGIPTLKSVAKVNEKGDLEPL